MEAFVFNRPSVSTAATGQDIRGGFFFFPSGQYPGLFFFLLINSAIYWVVLLSHQLLRPDPLYAVPCARGVANMNRAQNKAAGNLRIFRQTTGKMS